MVAWNPTANFFTNDEAISLVERLFHVAQKFETNNFRGDLNFCRCGKPSLGVKAFLNLKFSVRNAYFKKTPVG